MTGRMNAVLERVLSKELGRQSTWMSQDKENGFDVTYRSATIEEIKSFMQENDIKVRDDYYLEGVDEALN